MAELSYDRDKNIDIISMKGTLDEDDFTTLQQTISSLRQQGSTKILWLGKETEKIVTRNMGVLTGTIRIFRNMNGIIALAEFNERELRTLQETPWYKYLNVFKTETEAKAFLDPDD